MTSKPKKQTLHFKVNSEIKLPQDFIDSVPSQGAVDSAVEELCADFNIECLEQNTIEYLKSTGGWTLDELQDHETNLKRLVWIACLDCQENETTYFYMGL